MTMLKDVDICNGIVCQQMQMENGIFVWDAIKLQCFAESHSNGKANSIKKFRNMYMINFDWINKAVNWLRLVLTELSYGDKEQNLR